MTSIKEIAGSDPNLCRKSVAMQTELLIQSLVEQTRQIINRAEVFRELDVQTLSRREQPASWSVLECLEHLNLYGDFYLPQFQRKMANSPSKPEAVFRSGWLGDYFAKSMLPKERLNRMNTFRSKNPLHSNLNKEVVSRFLKQQRALLDILHASRKVSLNRVRIPTTLSPLISVNLGDGFRFYINHMLRHMAQAERAMAAAQRP